jgi:peptidoglycan L-alanyl-D-glutamate endopeptidase CwlK
MTLTARCGQRLAGVHPDLVRVVERAARDGTKFRVIEGLRTMDRQAELVRAGKSQTMRSRHLTGHAVDLAALDEAGRVTWARPAYEALAARVKAAAAAEGVLVEWGGDWRSFFDGPHFQLPWASYPA